MNYDYTSEKFNLKNWSLNLFVDKIKSIAAYRTNIVVILLNDDLSNSKVFSKTDSV